MTAHVFDCAPPILGLAKAEHVDSTIFSWASGPKITEFAVLLQLRLWHAGALGIAIGASEMLTSYPMLSDAEPGAVSISGWILTLLMNRIFALITVVAALTAAQVWISRRRARLFTMTMAIIAIGIAMSSIEASDAWRQFWGNGPLIEHNFSLFLYLFWITAAFGSMLAFLYETQMRADRAMEAVRIALIADEVVERQTLESRLNGMKARVDPEFLFTVIARIEGLYREDIDAAERLLEQLIDFLRATLPRGTDAAANLEQEIKLCGAYLKIEKSLRRDALSYQTKSDAGATNSYFPPAVVLPLLQALLLPGDGVERQIHLSVTAERQLARVKIELTCHAVTSPPPRELLESAAASLRTFFGENVSVVTNSTPFTGSCICIEVPHVAT